MRRWTIDDTIGEVIRWVVQTAAAAAIAGVLIFGIAFIGKNTFDALTDEGPLFLC